MLSIEFEIEETDSFDLEGRERISYNEFFSLLGQVKVGQYIRFQLIIEKAEIPPVSYFRYDADANFERFFSDLIRDSVKKGLVSKTIGKQVLNEVVIGNKKKQPNSKAKPFQAKRKKIVKIKSSKRKLLYVSAVFFSMTLATAGVIGYFNFFVQSPTSEVKTITFSDELSSTSPLELAKKYPDKLDKIESYLVEEKEWDLLSSFNDAFPTDIGTFDLAFHDKNWDTVIKTNLANLTDTRKVMLAYAYLQLNQIEEAYMINTELESEQVSQEIDQKIFDNGIKFLEKKDIKSATTLKEMLSTSKLQENYQEALDNAALIIQMIEFYEKKQDKTNQDIWERKLESLGKE